MNCSGVMACSGIMAKAIHRPWWESEREREVDA